MSKFVHFIRQKSAQASPAFNHTRLRLGPADAGALASRGYAYVESSDWDAAIGDCSRALDMEPGNPIALLARASAYRAKGEIAASLRDFTDYLDVNPTNDFALKSRASLYNVTGDFDKAIGDWNAGLSLNPADPTGLAMRAYAYVKTANYELALNDLNKALKFDAKNGPALNNLAFLRASSPVASMRNGKEAVELATRACEVSKLGRWDWLDTLAAALAEAGRFSEASQREKQALVMKGANAAERSEMRQRLTLYDEHRPFRLPRPETAQP